MKKFKLKETVVTAREESFTVRELTHAERLQWVKIAGDDRFRGPSLLVSLGCVDPKVTEADVDEMPIDVVEKLTNEIMSLSRLNTTKQPDAGAAVPMQAESGVGSAAE